MNDRIEKGGHKTQFYCLRFISGIYDIIELKVELVYQDERIERYRVSVYNKKLVFERNKPIFLHSAIKHYSDWKLIEGPEQLLLPLREDIIFALKKAVE